MIERADRALAIAKDRERLTIRPDGSVTIQDSKRYQIGDQGCTCRDFFVRQATHAGMCKHAIARELYRLAQASAATLHTTQDQEQEQDQTAFVDVEARAFTRALLNISACFEFGDCQTMQIRIVGSLLELEADGHHEHVQGSDGSGQADERHTVALERDEFLRFWDAYRPQARSLSRITLFISLADSTLFVSSDTFAAVAQGTPPPSQEGRP